MILNDETFNNINKTFKQAFSYEFISCKCDFCGNNFQRSKKNVLRSHKNIKKDACDDQECINQKIKEVHVSKHGVKHPMLLPEIQEKHRQTCLENLGVEHPLQNKNSQEKFIQTCNKNLGVDYPMQNKEVQEKHKKKYLKEHGVEYYMQTKEFQEKSKKKFLETLGVENPMQNKEVQGKFKQTCLETLGVENPFQSNEIKQKIKQKNLDNIGVENPMQNKEVQGKSKQTCIKNYGKFPANNYGKTQKEIQDWLNSFGFNYSSDYLLLEGKEIDLYDPNIDIAIEYCGLFWHTENSFSPKTQYYHYEKYKKCLKQGVRLLTIFEDEWIKREKQCKEYIKLILGIIDHRIYARKCSVKEITKQDASLFFNEYHIQGDNNLSVISYGLFYEDKIVGAISLSLGRHHKQNANNENIVLDRVCFKDGVQVIGGSSKLFEKCKIWARENNYKKIISFSDNRWSLDEVYRKIGFKCDKEYEPDYSYVDLKRATKRLSKHSQKTDCSENMTELEWANERGLSRIWDCGKKRWVIKI